LEHVIEAVVPGSPAYRNGLRPGDVLLSINNEALIDHIDYQALSAKRHLILHVRKADGSDWHVELIKNAGTPLGLTFGESMVTRPRVCKNKCIFCFIDQMPPACRDTLYVKDDDWRMSLMMGNFITLTNVDDEEFDRILRRRVSPLYISVHATNPDVRVQLMKNPSAARILERLTALKERGIKFHCQIVLCPGVNDGKVLEETLETLTSLAPAAQSAALVPVGLTKYRDGLYPLSPYTKEQAQEVLTICDAWQNKCMAELGTRFVFPSDELLCIAGRSLPQTEEYEHFPQIENGVGLMRRFLNGLIDASKHQEASARCRRVLIPCGKSIAPYLKEWISAFGPKGVDVCVLPVRNFFFGETVTVTGLLTGGDILSQISEIETDEILLCSVTLRAEGDLFLDDMHIDDFRAAARVPVRIVPNTGSALYQALLGRDDTSFPV